MEREAKSTANLSLPRGEPPTRFSSRERERRSLSLPQTPLEDLVPEGNEPPRPWTRSSERRGSCLVPDTAKPRPLSFHAPTLLSFSPRGSFVSDPRSALGFQGPRPRGLCCSESGLWQSPHLNRKASWPIHVLSTRFVAYSPVRFAMRSYAFVDGKLWERARRPPKKGGALPLPLQGRSNRPSELRVGRGGWEAW